MRSLFKKKSNRYLSASKIFRRYGKKNFPNEFTSIPLSFVLNDPFVKTVPIGMLSKSSIEKNIKIATKPLNTKITDFIGEWCKDNCQIFD